MEEKLILDDNFIGDIVECMRDAADKLGDYEEQMSKDEDAELEPEEYLEETVLSLREDILNLIPGSHLIEKSPKNNTGYGWFVDIDEDRTNYAYACPYMITVILHDGKDAQCAILYNPLEDVLIHAKKDGGAYVTTVDGTKELEMDPYGHDGVVLFLYPKHKSKDNQILEHINMLSSVFSNIKSNGPTLFDIEKLVTGQAVLQITSEMSELEKAAAKLIIPEANGVYEKINGLYACGTTSAVNRMRNAVTPPIGFILGGMLIMVMVPLIVFTLVLAVIPNEVFDLKVFLRDTIDQIAWLVRNMF